MTPLKYLVVGASRSGLLTAQRLGAEGHEVTLVSRRGGQATAKGVRHLALDASDPAALARVAAGTQTIFNCAMPAYDRWPREFPVLAGAVLAAAEQSGADLVTLGNIYGYGELTAEPIVESRALNPISVKGVVRAGMWAAARASRARVTEVRASDFLGRGVVSYFTWMVLPSISRGETASFPGDLDALHSWTFTDDVVSTLIAASRSGESWGRAWHVPSIDLSLRELTLRTARIAGFKEPGLRRMSLHELAVAATEVPVMREVMEMAYLFEKPCLLNAEETARALRVAATPVERVIEDMVAA